MRESKQAREKRARQIARRLHRAYPDARCTLDFRTPLQLLVATILSAQCTDARVNSVTKALFRKYRKPEEYVKALVRAKEASGTPIVVVVRPPLDTAGMEMAAPLQKAFWEAGFPVFATVPRAANAIAKTLRWRDNRPV